VYSGPGTGVAPGHTDTGGADTMEEHPKMGTTGETAGDVPAGGSIDRSSPLSDMDRQLGKPPANRSYKP
jgi:hypothetical protein